MTNASPAAGGPRFSLAYLKQLGVSALWLQPIHPRGIDGRQTDPATNRPFELGSPYAVKNYLGVMPLMASGFTPGSSPAANDTPQGRAAALTEFQNFVKAANAQHITVFLDVPFNHTAHDTELAAPGQHYWGNAGTADTTEIRTVEARIFSRSNEYDQRANSASNIAAAPDRYDFGKWADVQIFISADTPPSSPISQRKKTIKTRVTGSTTAWGLKTATARAMVISTSIPVQVAQVR